MGRILDRIRSTVKADLVSATIQAMLKSATIPKDVLKKAVDGFLDPIEEYVDGTSGKLDDLLIGRPIAFLREIADIDDDD